MSTIPQLTLFPLYPGGPQVRNTGGINAYSSFYLRGTNFTPAYGVNTTPQTSRTSDQTYFTINSNQTLTSQNVSSASVFSKNIGFDGSVLGGLRQTPVPVVAPAIPDLYREMAALLSISDLKMADLMAQPSFRLPTIGMGLKVTTDGMGGVDTIEISPSSRGINPDVPVIGKDFGRPNRAEITTGATFRADPPVGLAGASRANSTPAAKPTQNLLNNAKVPQFNPNDFNINSLNRNAGIFNLDRLDALKQFPEIDLDNAILQRLAQLQPQEQGLPVFGFDATINAQQARQIAVNQAGLDIVPGNRFRDNIASLASARPGESYGAAFRPQMMDGRIPMAPSLPNTGAGGAQTGSAFGDVPNFSLGASVADAMSRKGSGGYIPFNMSSGGGQGGQPSPFMMGGGMASGGRSSQQQRKPLAFIA